MKHPTNKLYYLEGIRGVAALIVLVVHLKNAFAIDIETRSLLYLTELTGSGNLAAVLNSFVNILFDGKLAVQVFWFMSGYVISIKLFSQQGNQYLTSAFVKRYFRLAIPVLGSVLLAYVLLKQGWMYNTALAEVQGEKYAMWLESYQFTPDLLYALKDGLWNSFFNYDAAGSYNPNLWTMNAELYGSFFCFFLFGIFRTRPIRYYAYLIIGVVALLLGYYWLVTFIAGFLLCDIDHTQNKLRPILEYLEKRLLSKWPYALMILVALIIIEGVGIRYYGPYVLIFVSTAVIIVITRSKPLRDLFSSRPFVWLGRISFSLYLIHYPIICSLSCWLFLNLGLSVAGNAILSSVITILVVLVAAVVYARWVDRFAVGFSNRLAGFVLKRWQ